MTLVTRTLSATEPAATKSQTGRLSRLTRDRLLVALGCLWLLDAALQYQPIMFGQGFFKEIVLPTAQGQPGWVTALLNFGHRVAGPDMGWFNIGFATLQLLIGVGILARYRPRIQRLALGVSVVWCLVIWIFGEGLGQILSNQGSGLIGSPGSALIYAVVALLLWPRKQTDDLDPACAQLVQQQGVSVASGGLLGDLGGRIAWALMWVGLFVLSIDGPNLAPNSYSEAIASNASSVPGFLAGFYNSVAHALMGQGPMLGVMIGAFELVIGLGVLVKDRGIRDLCLVVGISISLFYWVFGQGFGGITSGSGTDPNSGPLFVLLALAIWARSSALAGGHQGATPAGASVPIPAADKPDSTAGMDTFEEAISR